MIISLPTIAACSLFLSASLTGISPAQLSNAQSTNTNNRPSFPCYEFDENGKVTDLSWLCSTKARAQFKILMAEVRASLEKQLAVDSLINGDETALEPFVFTISVLWAEVLRAARGYGIPVLEEAEQTARTSYIPIQNTNLRCH